VPTTSLEVVYTVVAASREAEEVYKAILKVCPEVVLKSCFLSRSSFLKLVQRANVTASRKSFVINKKKGQPLVEAAPLV